MEIFMEWENQVVLVNYWIIHPFQIFPNYWLIFQMLLIQMIKLLRIIKLIFPQIGPQSLSVEVKEWFCNNMPTWNGCGTSAGVGSRTTALQVWENSSPGSFAFVPLLVESSIDSDTQIILLPLTRVLTSIKCWQQLQLDLHTPTVANISRRLGQHFRFSGTQIHCSLRVLSWDNLRSSKSVYCLHAQHIAILMMKLRPGINSWHQVENRKR